MAEPVSTLQAAYGGEDAFFTSSVGGGAFGVADGVGGWQESGINPAGTTRLPTSTLLAVIALCVLLLIDDVHLSMPRAAW